MPRKPQPSRPSHVIDPALRAPSLVWHAFRRWVARARPEVGPAPGQLSASGATRRHFLSPASAPPGSPHGAPATELSAVPPAGASESERGAQLPLWPFALGSNPPGPRPRNPETPPGRAGAGAALCGGSMCQCIAESVAGGCSRGNGPQLNHWIKKTQCCAEERDVFLDVTTTRGGPTDWHAPDPPGHAKHL